MARSDTRRSPFRAVLALLLVLVIAAGAYAAVLYTSAQKANEHINLANESYEQCLSQLEQEQYDDALVTIHTTIQEISMIRQELGGWQWDVAEKLPYLSQDVTCGRQASLIADQLASDALLPVIEQTEGIMDDINSADPITGLGNAFGRIGDLYQSLTSARQVVSDCKKQADALPVSHFDAVNQWANSIREAATEADESFGQLDGVFSAINTLGDFAESLNAPEATTETEIPEAETEQG